VKDEWICNSAMRRLLATLEDDSRPAEMPPWLRELLSPGLIERDDVLLLRCADVARHPERDGFPDATGYEAVINHFHVDSLGDGLDDFRLALGATGEIRRQLQETVSAQPVRIIISRNLSGEYIGSTVRFHRVRPGETWLSDDLEGYGNEAVGFLDVRPS
jgi:hypothetical protein